MITRLFSLNQIKNVYPRGFSLVSLFLLGVIVLTLIVTGCADSNSSESELENENIPAEAEELISVELNEIEAIVTVETGSTLAIRSSAGTKDKLEDDVLDRVPKGRVLKIINKHEDNVIIDGYTWWEIEDTVSGISGWSAADFLEEIE